MADPTYGEGDIVQVDMTNVSLILSNKVGSEVVDAEVISVVVENTTPFEEKVLYNLDPVNESFELKSVNESKILE